MPCHVARYLDNNSGNKGWAVIANGVYPIAGDYIDTSTFLTYGREAAFEVLDNLNEYEDKKLDIDSVEILSPITKPCRIICQGSNYPNARIETGGDPDQKDFNTLFHKSDASITGPFSNIIKPNCVKLLDYEIEIALVIGKEIDGEIKVTRENILDYVAGIVMVHDVTARDIQIPQIQFYKGKSYRTFCPTGPYLCLLKDDEYTFLDELNLRLSVNGKLKQKDHSSNMIYKPHETLAELSMLEDLAPGDLIFTGSPGGCALSVPPPFVVKILGLLPESLKWKVFVEKQAKKTDYLKPGDSIEASVKSDNGQIDLGTQKNVVISE